jgi:hypothetical protein
MISAMTQKEDEDQRDNEIDPEMKARLDKAAESLEDMRRETVKRAVEIEEELLWAKERQRKTRQAMRVSAVVSGLGLAAWLILVLSSLRGPNSTEVLNRQLAETMTTLRDKQAKQATEVAALRAAQERLALDLRNADPKLAAGSSIANTLAELTTKITDLEKVVLEKPAKTLEVHLLRSEVERIRADYQSAELRAAKDIERVYDLAKWLFSAVAVGVLGVVLKALFESRAKPPTAEAGALEKAPAKTPAAA